jgi:hypothetical protein
MMARPRAGRPAPMARRGLLASARAIAAAGGRATAILAAGMLWTLPGAPAAAQEGPLRIPLRSGEHGGYTRIALTLPEPAGWRFGRAGDGYALVLERPGVAFDTSGVFGPIGRARLAAIGQVAADPGGGGAPPGALGLELACPCHAVAFSTAAGVIAIDILPGPPPEGSPFEVAIAEAATRRAGEGATPTPAPAPATGRPPPAPPRPARIAALAAPAAASPGPTEAEAPPPTGPDTAAAALPVPRPPAPLPGAVPADPTGAAREPRIRAALEPVLGASATAPAEAERAAPADPPADPAQSGAPAPEPGPAPVLADAAAPAAAGDETGNDATGNDARGGDETGAATDPRLAAAQEDLLRGLAEAAGRGVIDLEGPLADALAAARNPRRPDAAGASGGTTTDDPAANADGAGQMRLRDPNADGRADTTAAGAPCVADADVDIGSWGAGDDPFGALAERRLALVGEFDRPDPAAVGDLARAYLYAGFGAEARNALAAFAPAAQPVEAEGAATLAARPGAPLEGLPATLATMGDVLDAKLPAEPHAFSGMEVCDGHAAMWAVLARPALAPGDQVDRDAVARAFAALPLHLRQLLAPDLTRRFIDAGDTHTAQRLREILARPPGAEGGALDLVDARFDVAGGAPDRGEAALRALAAEDGPRAAEALAELVDSRVRRGAAPDEDTLTALAAAAREYRATPEGAELDRSLARGLAAAGDFDAALGAMLPPDDPARGEIWEILATRGDDAALLRHAVPAAGRALPGPSGATRLDIAARLLVLGFAEAALGWVGSADDDRARLIRARAELARNAPGAALAALDGVGGEAADLLRAEALMAEGAAAEAARLLAAAGDAAGSRRAALRAGDFATAAGGDDPLGRALAALAKAGADPDAGADGEPEQPSAEAEGAAEAARPGTAGGPLAEGRALVERTAAQRAALASLLEAIVAPLTAAPGPSDGAAAAPEAPALP